MACKPVNLPHGRTADGKRVNVARASALLGCSRSWVYRLVSEGKLRAYRIGNRKGLQVTMKSLDAYLGSRQVAATDVDLEVY